MSMIGNLARIPEVTRQSLHQSPAQITDLIYPGHGKITSITPIPEEDKIDIDKTWHVIHFLFTESDWEGDFPQGFLLSCGEPVGAVDVGYGPARSFSAAQVKEIADFLGNQSLGELRSRLEPAKLGALDIYPQVWGDCQIDDEWDYAKRGLEDVMKFVRDTAERDMAMLVYLN